MVKAHDLDKEEQRKLEVLYRASGIQYRYTTIEDYENLGASSFFPDTENFHPFPTTRKRNEWFKREALILSEQSILNCLRDKLSTSEITHLITVSCTGMYAPGLDIELVEKLKLPTNVERTAINFMGCYAAFNAIKVANYICQTRSANVLVVCTELCSIHFQKEKNEDNLLANALFGDGSATLLIQSDPLKGINFRLDDFRSELMQEGKNDMAWNIGDTGFEMKLSAYVPTILESGIKPILKSMLPINQEGKFDFYAIHPGGRKILEVVESVLSITKEQNRYSHEILKNFGNMSSPTIAFILKRIMNTLAVSDHGKDLLAIAFGPGLTIEKMQAKVIVR